MSAFGRIFKRSVLQLVRRPIYWVAIFLLPLFCFLLLSSLMEEGLPIQAPAAIVDNDGTALSREVSQQLAGMQMVDVKATPQSFTEARHLMQEGKIYGYFLIPENFEADLLAGRGPAITFYTNMTFYVPATLLYKTFKTTALYTKAGVAAEVVSSVGYTQNPAPLLQPVNIVTRPIGNPGLNYGIYLCVSFIPCVLQLMILLVTCFSLGQEIKYGSSVRLMQMAGGNIFRAVGAKLLPQTLLWWVMAIFMESWLFGWMGYPMRGSWWWITLSQLMFVLASQGFGLLIFSALPNLRLSLSVSALLGILSFSIAAFSFPMQSMYGAIAIFSYIVPTRYNFLIYIDQALNGIDIYYSRWWFVAYIIFMVAPLPLLPRLRKKLLKPVYVP
ncbi:MAG: ABC transporter permease [Muribaculaceae bacterium]|nr:ABC transporter permease [Muribaculaceae bacterium]